MAFFKKGESLAAKIAKIAAMVVGGLALAALFGFAFGLVVKLLWNWLMPELFGLKEISYWQAWGLVILSHILIKPGYGGNGGGHGKDRGKRPAFTADGCGPDRTAAGMTPGPAAGDREEPGAGG